MMVDLTRHPREIIDPVWSRSFVCNLFRYYEYWFGRRAGIRFEGAYVNGAYVHGTWENWAAHIESKIRTVKVLVTKLELAVPTGTLPLGYSFSIAFDNASNTPNSASSLSYTVTGTNPFLFAGNYGGSASVWTGTYNSVAMTSGTGQIWIGSSNPINGAYLVGPATGSHTLAASNTGNFITAASYSGVSQVAPDQYVLNNNTVNNGAVPITFTTSTANCWGVMFVVGTNGTVNAGTNATARVTSPALGGGGTSCMDTNGTIATGSVTMSPTISAGGASEHYGMVGYKFQQAGGGATVNSGFLTIL